MIKVTEIVEELITQDEITLESLREGLLNLSAYATIIQPLIEKKLYKKVKKGTIVTALSRLEKKVNNWPKLRPEIKIEDLSIKSPLCEITYERTKETIQQIAKAKELIKAGSFATETQGITEISLIVPQVNRDGLLKKIGVPTKGIYDNLAGITVRFAEKDYVEVPNMIYGLVAAIGGKRINLIEIISTFTEITFVVRERDMEQTITCLNKLF